MIGTVKIGNKRAAGISRLSNFTSVDCDRKNPILGNPHVLHNHLNDEERAEVIEKYRLDYEKDWLEGGPMKEETLKLARRVWRGENLLLNCWCAGPPTNKPCHVELIKEKIEAVIAPFLK